MPSPDSVKPDKSVPAARFSVAPSATESVPSPSASAAIFEFLPKLTVPAETANAPIVPASPETESVPVPVFSNVPAPASTRVSASSVCAESTPTEIFESASSTVNVDTKLSADSGNVSVEASFAVKSAKYPSSPSVPVSATFAPSVAMISE